MTDDYCHDPSNNISAGSKIIDRPLIGRLEGKSEAQAGKNWFEGLLIKGLRAYARGDGSICRCDFFPRVLQGSPPTGSPTPATDTEQSHICFRLRLFAPKPRETNNNWRHHKYAPVRFPAQPRWLKSVCEARSSAALLGPREPLHFRFPARDLPSTYEEPVRLEREGRARLSHGDDEKHAESEETAQDQARDWIHRSRDVSRLLWWRGPDRGGRQQADGRRRDYIEKGGRIMVAMGGRGAVAGVLCEVW